MTSVRDIVKEHIKASRELRKSFKKSPAKARKLLIAAGILKKSGKGLTARYR